MSNGHAERPLMLPTDKDLKRLRALCKRALKHAQKVNAKKKR